MVRRLLKTGVAAGAAVLGLEAAYAILKPSPLLPEFDPSDEFGDPTDPMLRVAALGDSSVTAPGVTGPEEIWITLVCQRPGREEPCHPGELRSRWFHGPRRN